MSEKSDGRAAVTVTIEDVTGSGKSLVAVIVTDALRRAGLSDIVVDDPEPSPRLPGEASLIIARGNPRVRVAVRQLPRLGAVGRATISSRIVGAALEVARSARELGIDAGNVERRLERKREMLAKLGANRPLSRLIYMADVVGLEALRAALDGEI